MKIYFSVYACDWLLYVNLHVKMLIFKSAKQQSFDINIVDMCDCVSVAGRFWRCLVKLQLLYEQRH